MCAFYVGYKNKRLRKRKRMIVITKISNLINKLLIYKKIIFAIGLYEKFRFTLYNSNNFIFCYLPDAGFFEKKGVHVIP